jgi:Tfp pilus assembly PilM family ATPase
MPQLLALEWNGSEARVAVASRHGGQTVVEQAFLIPLRSAPAEEGQPEPDIGQQITAALAARGIGQMDVLVAVGRGSVELRQLQLPAATDEELPKMVRLQALFEFNEMDERWLLDFVPVDEAGRTSRTVLAAAIAPALIDRIQEVCQRSGLKMRHLVLRSCAAAALVGRAQTARLGEVRLLVELASDQADLTATVDGKVLFLRTMRLTGDPLASQSLLAEIRLTMAAMQNQFGGRKVTRIVLCGQGAADAALAEQIEKETGTGTTLFDPFTGLELGPQLRASPPEHPGRFAPVLGMLLADLDQAGHAIDFLHPRQPVKPANPRKKWWLAAAAAGLLLLTYLVVGGIQHWWLAGEVNELAAKSKRKDKDVAAANKDLASAAEIGKWADGEVVWLDQLRELSGDFPPAEKAALGQLTLTYPPAAAAKDVRGEMQLKGWARSVEAIAAMEQGLRAHGRRVIGSNSREDRSVPPYSWHFETSVLVGREAKP